MFQRLVEYSITTTDDMPFDVSPCLLPYEPSWFADAHPQLQSAVGPAHEWHSFALLASMLLSFDAGAQWYVDVLSYNFAVLDDADLPLGNLRVTGSDQFGAVYVFVPVVTSRGYYAVVMHVCLEVPWVTSFVWTQWKHSRRRVRG